MTFVIFDNPFRDFLGSTFGIRFICCIHNIGEKFLLPVFVGTNR